MNIAIKCRIYPTKEQQVLFAKTFGCCRKIYNLMLSDKIESYKNCKSFGTQTPAMYKDEYPYLREVDSLALANVQLHLQAAMRNHFSKKRKKRTGFPKFKSKRKSRKSYTTNNQNGSVAILDSKHIKLPKAGIVKAVIHRHPEPGWSVKSVTISQNNDGTYYASFLFEYEKDINPVPISNNAIGLDYASNGLYVDDQGNIGTNHKYYREGHKKLAKAQRKLSRMLEHNTDHYEGTKNNQRPVYKRPLEECKNIQKQKRIIAKIHRHIANQRFDNLHKISTEIANRYDIVCVETLNMKSLSNKKFRNGKATMDNGYGMFCDMLSYKLAARGKYFSKVGKWFPSSQICHQCGCIHKEMKDLNIRKMKCDCGLTMSRDQNAAINIKKEGLRLLQQA